MPSSLTRFAFLLHAVTEAPAAATFLLAPHRQLSPDFLASSPHAPEVLLIMQNLGGLLLATVLLSLVLAWPSSNKQINFSTQGSSDSDTRRGLLALSLGIYHLFPCRRAYRRLRQRIGMAGPQKQTLGGPQVHLVVHIVCFVLLAGAGLMELAY